MTKDKINSAVDSAFDSVFSRWSSEIERELYPYDSLFLDYVDDKSSSEEDIVDSVPLPDDYYRLV